MNKWKDSNLYTKINFHSFPLDSLEANVINQIVPKKSNTNKTLKTLNEMALDHLNCKEYENSFQKFCEIKTLQNNFNNSVNTFLDNIRINIRQFLTSNNIIFTNNELDMLLRYYLYWIADKNRMPDGFENRIENYHGKINFGHDEIINPFPNIEEEIKNYIITTNEIQSKNLIELNEMNDRINKNVIEFQESLEPIIDNSVIGIKGNCIIENNLSHFKKFKCFILND